MIILTFRHGVLSHVNMVRNFFEDFGATIQARFLTFSNSKTYFFFHRKLMVYLIQLMIEGNFVLKNDHI